MGCIYIVGQGVEPNRKAALDFFEESAKLGNSMGMFNWGFTVLMDGGDMKKAEEYLKNAEDLGCGSVMNEVGVLYEAHPEWAKYDNE